MESSENNVQGQRSEAEDQVLERQALIEINDDQISELVRYCDEEWVEELRLSSDEIVRLKKQLTKTLVDNDNSVPMICEGNQCIFKDSCPLISVNRPPIGKKCAIELMLLNKWRKEYVESMKIDWNDKNDRQMVLELLELDILSTRANSVLAVDGFMMENVVGMNEQTGAPITRKEKHIALDVKEMVYRRKSKVLQEMIATREAKAKFMNDMRGDPSMYAAQLRAKAEALREERIIDVDDIHPLEEENATSETNIPDESVDVAQTADDAQDEQ